jgi:tetrahydrodipicolinate N-succinyltransferase
MTNFKISGIVGCVIKSGSKISKSIIAGGVSVGMNCVIPQGCILSYGVIIGDNVTLPENTRLSLFSQVKINIIPLNGRVYTMVLCRTRKEMKVTLASSALVGRGSFGLRMVLII